MFLGLIAVLGGVAACGKSNDGLSAQRSALTAECSEPGTIPDGAWVCPNALTVECGGVPETIYVSNDESTACDGALSVSEAGPFSGGTHSITVSDADGAVCTAELTVTDSQAPVLESQGVVKLWPPNHKFHSVAVEDCVSATDACDGALQGEFIWASSDEPIDDIGDGHFAPDIGLGPDTQHVCVRSERQGPRDGRVYKLGVRVVDGAGNESEGTCTIIVDHDQRGVDGADSGDAYRIDFDPATAGTNCDGTPGDQGGSGGAGGAGAGGNGGAGAGGNGGSGGSDETTAGSGGSDETTAGSGGEGGSEETAGSGGTENGGEPVPQDVF